MQKDAFKPVGREISVVGMGGPMAPSPTRMMSVGPSAPTMARQPQPQQSQTPVMVAPSGRGAQISGSKEVPRGAQQVRLASAPPPPLDGGPIDRGSSFQPAGPGAPAAPGPEMAGPGPAPRPYLQRAANGSMIVRVVLRGVGPDGAPYEAPYDAEFAPGTHSFSVNFAPLNT